MNPVDPRANESSSLRGIALVAILVATAVAVVLPYLVGGLDFDTFTLRLMFVALGIVSVTALLQTRFLVLPSIVRGFRDAHLGEGEARSANLSNRAVRPPATVAELANQARILVLGFSVAPSIYGLVFAIQSGVGWLALPFTAVALITLLVLGGYVDTALEDIRKSLAMRGDQ